MIGHTQAFVEYRKLSQSHIDFVVLVCHAIPALRADIALPDQSLSHPPDHFKQARNPKDFVAGIVGSYQEALARTTLITVFSYFEAYVKDALTEIVEFHGGKDKMLPLARQRTSRFVESIDPTLKSHKRKLQDRPSPAKLAKYQKHAKILDNARFNFPTDLFAHFGLVQLLPKLGPDRGMQAWEVPSILRDCLLFPLKKEDHQTFDDIRLLRNRVAHGRAPTVAFPKSQEYTSILHALAARVDKHIAEHFLVIQPL